MFNCARFQHYQTSMKRDNSPSRSVKPQGLGYFPNYITEEEETELLNNVNSGEWSNELSRRVQHFGYKYDYRTRALGPSIQPLPDWSTPLLERTEFTAQQLIINEYTPGQSIGRHTDSNVFDTPILIVSLGSHCTMVFRKAARTYSILLERRSLVVMDGECRWYWTHEIVPRTHDNLKARTTRVSLTFRKIKPP